MENEDKNLTDDIHLEIHALRLIPNYKPSPFELKLSKMVAERYSLKCKECKDKLDKYNSTPVQNKKPGIMNRLKNAIGDTE